MAGDGKVDAVLAVAGDRLCNEALLAIELLRSELPWLRIRFVVVNELTSLGPPSEYEAALDGDRFDRLFPLGVPVIFPFLGHPGTLFRLLFRRPDPERFTVLGFRSQSGRHTPFETLVRCGTDRFSLAARIAAASTSGKAELQVERLTAKVDRVHASHRRFTVEHGTDPPWVDPTRTAQEALGPLWA
jgi:xylulose-5-phosphate/fructose-6-phosphate phosphoketolase